MRADFSVLVLCVAVLGSIPAAAGERWSIEQANDLLGDIYGLKGQPLTDDVLQRLRELAIEPSSQEVPYAPEIPGDIRGAGLYKPDQTYAYSVVTIRTEEAYIWRVIVKRFDGDADRAEIIGVARDTGRSRVDGFKQLHADGHDWVMGYRDPYNSLSYIPSHDAEFRFYRANEGGVTVGHALSIGCQEERQDEGMALRLTALKPELIESSLGLILRYPVMVELRAPESGESRMRLFEGQLDNLWDEFTGRFYPIGRPESLADDKLSAFCRSGVSALRKMVFEGHLREL